GAYPDVFGAGAAFMGVPFGCFATEDRSLWNPCCAEGETVQTAREWGDLVRAAHPGYGGRRPRMQLGRGTEAASLRDPNPPEAVKQWTDVLGVDATPVQTDHPEPAWTRTRYGDAGGRAPVEATTIQDGGHDLPTPGMAAEALRFFGLI